MPRASKLTSAQWTELERRYIAGETDRALGTEFGISASGIRKRLGARDGAQSAQVRNVAHLLADAEIKLQELAVPLRSIAVDLAEKLRNITHSVASAAELGAKTGHRLHALANAEVCKVDDVNVLSGESMEALKSVGVLTKLANESLSPALNLMNANKDRVLQIDSDSDLLPVSHQSDERLAYIATTGSH